MHIPDAFLSPATQGVTFAGMCPLWFFAAKKTSSSLTTKQMPFLSLGAAFCFAVQMFNIPALGGTTAHALGVSLLAIMVGPWAALLGASLTLAVQALLFGDGGVLSIGANSFNMAFVASFVSYGMFSLLGGRKSQGTRKLLAAGSGAYVGIVAASASAAFMLGLQPLIAHDAVGHALYCPFNFSVAFPAMVLTHLAIAGPAEAIVTIAALSYLAKAFPESVDVRAPRLVTGWRLSKTLAWLLVLAPVGLIASGSAWGEWDAGTLKDMIGYVPAGLAKAGEIVKPLLPDYGFAGAEGITWSIVGYLASGFVGCLLIGLFLRAFVKPKPAASGASAQTSAGFAKGLPTWMQEANPVAPLHRGSKFGLEKTIAKMRASLGKAIGSEDVARRPGFLQSAHPTAKSIGFLSAILAAAMSKTSVPLILLLAAVLLAAGLSQVPFVGLCKRVIASVSFFGLPIALPLCLMAVSGGPEAFHLGPIGFSSPGLASASMLLLRLSTSLSLAFVWTLTTPWLDLVGSLRSLGLPRSVTMATTMAYRYIFVLMETLGDMVEARTCRQVGAWSKEQARLYAGTGAAVLFAKSLALGEETHQAMLARGYEGKLPSRRQFSWRLADSALALGGLASVFMAAHIGGFHVF